MSSSAAPASAAETAMSTVKPTSPNFDFKMLDRRSSSSMTRRRTGSAPLSAYLSARGRGLRRNRSLRIPHQHHNEDADRDGHEGERIEGRGIAQPANQEARDDRPGRLANIPNGSEHTHGSAETPCG